jgi:hypothetical protein
MKIMITTIALLTATTCSLFAQTAEELKTQIAALDQQISSLRHSVFQDPQFLKLREDAGVAEKAYDQAVAQSPEISDLDKQIADLRQQEFALHKLRMQKEAELAGGPLAAQKAAKDDAEQKLQSAPPLVQLAQAMETKKQLEAKLSELEQAAASQPAK